MLMKLQYNHLHIYQELQSFHGHFFISILQRQISGMVTDDRTMDGLTERTNFVKINLERQENTMLFIFLSY